jgi:CRP/FNR family transcriptional regulator, cyclic AMP receptor protein
MASSPAVQPAPLPRALAWAVLLAATMPARRPQPDSPHPFEHPALSEALRALAARGVLRRYARGTLIIQEGDAGDSIHIVCGGRLRAFSVHPLNGREIVFGSYGPGEYVGEMSLDGGPRSASVIALEPTLCAVVSRAAITAFIGERPEFAFELLSKVIARARAATLSASQLAQNDVYGRLKGLLDSLAVAQVDGSRLVAGPLTQQEIAHRIGCTREMVGKVLRDLRAGGYVAPAGPGWRIAKALPARW